MSHQILVKILETVQEPTATGRPYLTVFDLDSTLFNVSPRLQKVLEDFAAQTHIPIEYPELHALLIKAKAEPTDWGFRQALQRAGMTHAPPDFQAAIRDFWRENFFSSSYLHYDEPISGAVEYVQALHQLGADIVYLTGRDHPRMGEGSAAVLKKWGFPLDVERSQLVLKPEKSMDDAIFKKDWFTNLSLKKYESIWFFENEPVIIDLIRQDCPQVQIVFMDSTHSGKKPKPEGLPTIRHFLKS